MRLCECVCVVCVFMCCVSPCHVQIDHCYVWLASWLLVPGGTQPRTSGALWVVEKAGDARRLEIQDGNREQDSYCGETLSKYGRVGYLRLTDRACRSDQGRFALDAWYRCVRLHADCSPVCTFGAGFAPDAFCIVTVQVNGRLARSYDHHRSFHRLCT